MEPESTRSREPPVKKPPQRNPGRVDPSATKKVTNKKRRWEELAKKRTTTLCRTQIPCACADDAKTRFRMQSVIRNQGTTTWERSNSCVTTSVLPSPSLCAEHAHACARWTVATLTFKTRFSTDVKRTSKTKAMVGDSPEHQSENGAPRRDGDNSAARTRQYTQVQAWPCMCLARYRPQWERHLRGLQPRNNRPPAAEGAQSYLQNTKRTPESNAWPMFAVQGQCGAQNARPWPLEGHAQRRWSPDALPSMPLEKPSRSTTRADELRGERPRKQDVPHNIGHDETTDSAETGAQKRRGRAGQWTATHANSHEVTQNPNETRRRGREGAEECHESRHPSVATRSRTTIRDTAAESAAVHETPRMPHPCGTDALRLALPILAQIFLHTLRPNSEQKSAHQIDWRQRVRTNEATLTACGSGMWA